MQTIPVNQQLTHKTSRHAAPTPNAPIPSLPRVARPDVHTKSGLDAKQTVAPQQSIQANPYAELDAMLIRDPNVGAVHGLRTALLFNAGLVLSGLMVWEIWSMLAS